MAAHEELVQPEAGNGEAKKPSTATKVLIFGALLIAGYFMLTILGVIGSDDTNTPASGATPDERFLDTEASIAGSERDEITLSDIERRFGISEPTKDGVIVQFQKEMEAYRNASIKFQRQEVEKRQELQIQVRELDSKLNSYQSKIVDLIDDRNYQSSVERRRGGEPVDADFPDLPFEGGGSIGGGQQPQSDAFPYFELGSARANAEDALDDGAELFGDVMSASPFEETAQNPSKTKEIPLDDEDDEDDSAEPPKFVERVVPAFSFAEVTTLHGVSCPTMTNTELMAKVFPNGGRPVIVPVRGKFHGPDGASHDLRGAHLFGICFGQAGKRPSAFIKVERLSYVGPDGKSKLVAINGYVADGRDNHEGIAGVLESNRIKNIGLISTAAGLSGFANAINQDNFTSETTGDGAVVSALKDGRATQAAGTGFLSSGFGKTAELLAKYGEMEISLVHIPAQVPVIFYLTGEFTYQDVNTSLLSEDYYDDPLL